MQLLNSAVAIPFAPLRASRFSRVRPQVYEAFGVPLKDTLAGVAWPDGGGGVVRTMGRLNAPHSLERTASCGVVAFFWEEGGGRWSTHAHPRLRRPLHSGGGGAAPWRAGGCPRPRPPPRPRPHPDPVPWMSLGMPVKWDAWDMGVHGFACPRSAWLHMCSLEGMEILEAIFPHCHFTKF